MKEARENDAEKSKQQMRTYIKKEYVKTQGSNKQDRQKGKKRSDKGITEKKNILKRIIFANVKELPLSIH